VAVAWFVLTFSSLLISRRLLLPALLALLPAAQLPGEDRRQQDHVRRVDGGERLVEEGQGDVDEGDGL
jgi:hypothetical protein